MRTDGAASISAAPLHRRSVDVQQHGGLHFERHRLVGRFCALQLPARNCDSCLEGKRLKPRLRGWQPGVRLRTTRCCLAARSAQCRIVAQVEALFAQADAVERQGYQVVAVYSDTERYRVGKKMVEPSGTRHDRPQLRAMLAEARAGAFDVILAWREDRLYRSYRSMLDVLDCLEDCENTTGLTIELAKEHFDQVIAPVNAWAAKMELQAKHDRVMMGVAARFESGKVWNVSPPYGYMRSGDFFVVNDREAQWVKKIWEWYGDWEKVSEIRRRLIASGAKQKRDNTKHTWGINAIRAILLYEPHYLGTYKITWDGATYEIPIVPIIDAETARRVSERRATCKTYPAGNLKEFALAAGVVYCKACGVRLRVTSVLSRGKRYL